LGGGKRKSRGGSLFVDGQKRTNVASEPKLSARLGVREEEFFPRRVRALLLNSRESGKGKKKKFPPTMGENFHARSEGE